MRELSASHKTLTILCYRELPPQYNLYIACIGPVEISSPVTWSDSNLCAELRSDGLFIVRDDQNRVRIICEGLEVKENVHV